MDINLFAPFGKSTQEMINQMSGIQVELLKEKVDEDYELKSFGVTSIISFTGKQEGRFLIDMEQDLALAIAGAVMGNDFRNVRDNTVLMVISEINNIIAGDAITYLNNEYSLSLRLAPPIVFTGRDVIISIPKIHSRTAHGETKHGRIKINIAWKGVK